MFVVNLLLIGLAAGGTAATTVTPHMDAPILPGRNVVYCSTFQIAWNDMRNEIIKDDIRLERQLELVRSLNQGLSTKADIDERHYLAMVGYGEDDIADRINAALKRKFGAGAPAIDERYNNDGAIVAYAYLSKTSEFPQPFEDFEKPLTFRGAESRANVEAFGVIPRPGAYYESLRDQVEVVDYTNADDFVIRLVSKQPEEEIVLASVAPGLTLLETIERVQKRVARAGWDAATERLRDDDVLQIPKIDLSIDHRYTALIGLHLMNVGFEHYFVDEARQVIDFTLDESGAVVKSAGEFVIKKGPGYRRALLFDGPFLLYIKKNDGRYPYFAVWVGHPEILVAAERSP